MFLKSKRKQSDFSFNDFYEGLIPDRKGLYLYDYWDMTETELENRHDYIQYMFPLTEQSEAVPAAPFLSEKEMLLFGKHPVIQANVRKSFEKMLDFYGLETRNGSIIESASFLVKAERWMTGHNHNFLRLTRILKSLILFGLNEEASSLYKVLSTLYLKYPGRINDESFMYWTDAIKMT